MIQNVSLSAPTALAEANVAVFAVAAATAAVAAAIPLS